MLKRIFLIFLILFIFQPTEGSGSKIFTFHIKVVFPQEIIIHKGTAGICGRPYYRFSTNKLRPYRAMPNYATGPFRGDPGISKKLDSKGEAVFTLDFSECVKKKLILDFAFFAGGKDWDAETQGRMVLDEKKRTYTINLIAEKTKNKILKIFNEKGKPYKKGKVLFLLLPYNLWNCSLYWSRRIYIKFTDESGNLVLKLPNRKRWLFYCAFGDVPDKPSHIGETCIEVEDEYVVTCWNINEKQKDFRKLRLKFDDSYKAGYKLEVLWEIPVENKHDTTKLVQYRNPFNYKALWLKPKREIDFWIPKNTSRLFIYLKSNTTKTIEHYRTCAGIAAIKIVSNKDVYPNITFKKLDDTNSIKFNDKSSNDWDKLLFTVFVGNNRITAWTNESQDWRIPLLGSRKEGNVIRIWGAQKQDENFTNYFSYFVRPKENKDFELKIEPFIERKCKVTFEGLPDAKNGMLIYQTVDTAKDKHGLRIENVKDSYVIVKGTGSKDERIFFYCNGWTATLKGLPQKNKIKRITFKRIISTKPQTKPN